MATGDTIALTGPNFSELPLGVLGVVLVALSGAGRRSVGSFTVYEPHYSQWRMRDLCSSPLSYTVS